MPYEIQEQKGQYCVVKQGESNPIAGGCHDTHESALKHMRALYAAEPNATMKYSAIVFSDDVLEADPEDNDIKWLKAWRYSTWEHPKYGTVEVTPELGQRFQQHFKEHTLGRDHLVNYDHGADPAKGGKAAGQILAIDPREDGIWYAVKFTDVAQEEIKKGEWRYLSPEYDDWIDPETGNFYQDVPFDLALTNTPFFKGMPPLNFSEVFEETTTPKEFAVWSTAFQNNLPDSCFLYIAPGGKKDSEGKTVPRTLRHFVYKGPDGRIDLPHLRNAIARIPQASIPDSLKTSLQARARKLLSGQGSNGSKSGSPKGGTAVDELTRQFAERLGLELPEDATEDQILSMADELNKTIEPLRKAKADGERTRTFREAFPEEFKEMEKLRKVRIESEAREFSESYRRFTIKSGDQEYKSTLGFSEAVIDEIAGVYPKFSERSAGPSELKKLLDLIGDKGIVDYAEHGSSRKVGDREWSDDPKLAFSEAIKETMTQDNVPYEAAMALAQKKYPDLFEAYQRSIPHR